MAPSYTGVLTATLVLCVMLAPDASAQVLLETDGVELRGEAQLLVSGGGTCNVLESDTAFEARQGNDGAPMDIWRLDFTVRNGSGRWLDHVIARYQIESEWPECTNWDRAQSAELANVGWTDTADFIQRSGRNVVGPNEALTQTQYFIVLQGDPEPRFTNWSVDFDFAVNPPAAGADSPAAAPTGSAEQETVFWQSIVDSTNPADFEAYLAQFPNGVFRALAENRLAALRALESDGAGRIASGPADTARRAGETRTFDGMEFVWVPAGEFRMGSTSSEARSRREQPVTQVRISRGFWLGRYEVTQAEWQGVMGTNPSYFPECGPSCPVEQVSWNDAQEFIRRLNERTGAGRYRLPTEAEWEYAARAGTTRDRYAANVDAIAWHHGNSGVRTHPVGQKAPNAWGLHDMLGNVSEWVQDWYDSYPGGTVTDPRGSASGSYRVNRGRSWRYVARLCRASDRSAHPPGDRFDARGFRLLRTE